MAAGIRTFTLQRSRQPGLRTRLKSLRQRNLRPLAPVARVARALARLPISACYLGQNPDSEVGGSSGKQSSGLVMLRAGVNSITVHERVHGIVSRTLAANICYGGSAERERDYARWTLFYESRLSLN